MSLIKKSNELVIPTTVKMMNLRSSRNGKEYGSIERTETAAVGLR